MDSLFSCRFADYPTGTHTGLRLDLELIGSRLAAGLASPRTETQTVRFLAPFPTELCVLTLLESRRPYRTYLATPILFASTALFLLVLSCFSKPYQSAAAFAFCGAGAIPYYLQVRRKGTVSRLSLFCFPGCAELDVLSCRTRKFGTCRNELRTEMVNLIVYSHHLQLLLHPR